MVKILVARTKQEGAGCQANDERQTLHHFCHVSIVIYTQNHVHAEKIKIDGIKQDPWFNPFPFIVKGRGRPRGTTVLRGCWGGGLGARRCLEAAGVAASGHDGASRLLGWRPRGTTVPRGWWGGGLGARRCLEAARGGGLGARRCLEAARGGGLGARRCREAARGGGLGARRCREAARGAASGHDGASRLLGGGLGARRLLQKIQYPKLKRNLKPSDNPTK
uniref:Uncharacterized protein n=1 Tax=Solanum lycopersicum TaxID=4081 RepID=A0A3Q7F2W7_SOLLC